MYGEVVAGIDKQAFDYELSAALARSQITNPADLPLESLEELPKSSKTCWSRNLTNCSCKIPVNRSVGASGRFSN